MPNRSPAPSLSPNRILNPNPNIGPILTPSLSLNSMPSLSTNTSLDTKCKTVLTSIIYRFC